MELFDSPPSEETLLKERADFLSDLADKMNSELYQGTKLIKNHFSFIKKFDIDDGSNIILGNIEGYNFCFVEDYCIQASKHNRSHWESKFIIEMKQEKFPDFSLEPKKQAIKNYLTGLLITLAIFFIPYFVSFFKKDEVYYIALIISVCIGLIVLTICIEGFKNIYQQDKYKINNYSFKEKYVISSKFKPERIREVLTDKVCKKIVNYPYDLNIRFEKKCIDIDFPWDEKLSYNSCNALINKYIRIVKLFENDSES